MITVCNFYAITVRANINTAQHYIIRTYMIMAISYYHYVLSTLLNNYICIIVYTRSQRDKVCT